jgi:hypothetical protein
VVRETRQWELAVVAFVYLERDEVIGPLRVARRAISWSTVCCETAQKLPLLYRKIEIGRLIQGL